MKSTINPITRRCQICVNKGGRHFEMEIQVYLASYFAFFSQLLNKAFMDSLSHNIVALFLLVEHTVEVCTDTLYIVSGIFIFLRIHLEKRNEWTEVCYK